MTIDRDRKTWLILATGSAALALASILVTHRLGLQPCHLCLSLIHISEPTRPY